MPAAGDAGWAGALRRRLPGLIAVDAAVAPPEPGLLRTCHRDLNTENVLRAVSGGIIVLDWENSGPAQPERELAAIVSGLAADVGTQAARTAHAAYQAAGGPNTKYVRSGFCFRCPGAGAPTGGQMHRGRLIWALGCRRWSLAAAARIARYGCSSD